ncbi:magnesium transporter [Clostridia bacterium]|nr:magnesium transporter [Clostridia bacterium]
MLNIYKSVEGVIRRQESFSTGCWFNLVTPTDDEIETAREALDVDAGFLRAALDEEETSRVEIEDGQTLIIIDVPSVDDDQLIADMAPISFGRRDRKALRRLRHERNPIYSTIPMGIVITDRGIATVATRTVSPVREIADGLVKGANPAHKTRFIFTLLLRVATRFLQYLRQIDKVARVVEHKLYAATENKELIQLLRLEKSLVFFSTSLKANEVTLEKILRGRILKLYDEDKDLLEDVLIEVRQAIEMANIYSTILSGTMDAFASIISNNVNVTMKMFAALTILITIPNIIYSFYGMNVEGLPLIGTPIFAVGLSAVMCLLAGIIMKRRNMF